jgi:hypothetical protein
MRWGLTSGGIYLSTKTLNAERGTLNAERRTQKPLKYIEPRSGLAGTGFVFLVTALKPQMNLISFSVPGKMWCSGMVLHAYW